MDGWNISFLLGWPIFSGYVSFREGIFGGIEETLNDLCPERVSAASLSMGPDLENTAQRHLFVK